MPIKKADRSILPYVTLWAGLKLGWKLCVRILYRHWESFY